MHCKVHVRFGGGGQLLSYYGWRGADINNILDFEKDWPEAEVIRLEENYRSVPDILECANTIIRNNKKRKKKSLWTANQDTTKKVLVKQLTRANEEAYYVGSIIKNLRENDKYDYDDFVVLYRTNNQSRNFEEQFRRLDIPYKSVGSIAFYERAEIKDLLAYLSLLVNENDDISFNRIVNVPSRRIGAKSVEKLQEYANFKGWSLYKSLLNLEDIPTLSKAVKTKFLQFRELMESMKVDMQDKDLDESLQIIYERSGYEDLLSKDSTVNGESKKENVKELIGAAKERKNEGVNQFLENAALSASIDELDDSKKVTLMTIHSAKGLEFPVVFLTGLEENLFPSYQSIQNQDIEEERRLCYVGITRAKERLFLTYARERMLNGDIRYERPSRFLSELPQEIVELNDLDSAYDSFEKPRESESFLYHPTMAEESLESFFAGDKVRHKMYGDGTVVQVKGHNLLILFPGEGPKTIADSYVKKL